MGLNQRKDLNVLPTPVSHPGAPIRSTSHIHPPHWSEHDRLVLNRGRRGQETADSTDPAGTIAFGSRCQILLLQGTALTVGLVGEVDGPLS